MHRAPRGIGHTNQLASVLVETPTGDNDYVGGIELFVGFFIITPFVLWILFLFAVKLKHLYINRTSGKYFKGLTTPKTITSQDPKAKTPSPKASKDQTAKNVIPSTSWIAGGDVIDMYKLSRAGVSRKERKRLVLRSWRLQSTFLSVSILIPVLSVVLIECGWKPFETAMLEIRDLNDDVKTLADRGKVAVERLEVSKDEMFADNELVQLILEYSYSHSAEPEQKSFIEDEDDRNHNRRAQVFQSKQATNSPTFDFDSELFMPWIETVTSPPIEQDDSNMIDNDKRVFESIEPEIRVEGKDDASTSLYGFFNTSFPSIPTSGIFIDDWCPDAIRFIGSEELNYWTESINNLTERTHTINQIFSALEITFPSMESSSPLWSETEPPGQKSSAFQFVTDATNYVDKSIEWFLANDWLLKLLILVLNVVNGLLLANVYFFSKNNIIHQPTRLYVAYILVPLFVFAAASIVAVTVATGVAVLINSDFCFGVDGPQGTIEEAILTIQEQQELSGATPNEALSLVYDSVYYYWTVRITIACSLFVIYKKYSQLYLSRHFLFLDCGLQGCLSENPLEFLQEFSDEIDDAAARINEFTVLFPLDGFDPVTNGMVTQPGQMGPPASEASDTSPRKITLSVLEKACERDMSFLSPSVHDLKRQVDQIRTNIHRLSNTFSCGQVSPLLRRISHGAVCVESPQGLAVLWGTSFGISILCFILLTVRAALYNSVKYKKRRPTKPRRIVEKEFDEYKEFMGKYYGEDATKKWKIDGIPVRPTKLELAFDEDLELKGTFDTAKSSKESSDDSLDDDGSEKAGIFVRKMDCDLSSYGSSYDSECSDDENSSDSESKNGDDLSSAIGSFLSETKSMAMQTIHSLRNVKSLLSTLTRNKNPPSHVGNSNMNLGDLNGSNEDDIADYDNEVFFTQKVDTMSDLGFDGTKSVTNSISDDSLYLPTPTSRAGKNTSSDPLAKNFSKNSILALSKDFGFSDEEDVKDEEDKILASHSRAIAKGLRTPTNSITKLSPSAPRKPISFLPRTLYTRKEDNGNYTDEELNSLVKPKQLANLNSFRSTTHAKSKTRLGKSRGKTGRNKPTSTRR